MFYYFNCSINDNNFRRMERPHPTLYAGLINIGERALRELEKSIYVSFYP